MLWYISKIEYIAWEAESMISIELIQKKKENIWKILIFNWSMSDV